MAVIDRRLRALSQELNDAAVAVQSRRDALAGLRRKQTELTVAEHTVAQLQQNIQQEESNLAAIRERIESAGELTSRAHEIEQGAKLLDDARVELNRLELVRREHGALQDQRTALITTINRQQASLESEIGELERRIREDLEPAASLAERTAIKLSELAETERGLTNEQHAIDAQAEQISNLTAEIAARTSDLERCVEEGKDLRAKQQEMSIARGPDAVCPLCRSPLSEDACTNIAGWYESEIAGKLRLHSDLTVRVKGLTQQRETLAAQTEAQSRALIQRQRAAQQERGRLEQQRRQSEDAGELLHRCGRGCRPCGRLWTKGNSPWRSVKHWREWTPRSPTSATTMRNERRRTNGPRRCSIGKATSWRWTRPRRDCPTMKRT